jgi:PAS domain S-box-containing protein
MLLNARRLAGPGTTTDGHILLAIEDVTDRQRADQELAASEDRLRRVLDNAAVGLTRCSRDWVYLSANPAYARIAGKPLAQIEGRPVVDVLGAEGVETIRPYVERVLRGEHVDYEGEVPFNGAGRRYLRVRYTPDTDPSGRIVGWVACVADITDRKQAEAELLESREQLRRERDLSRTTIDTAPVIFLVLDPAGKVLQFNPYMEQLTGWSQEEARGLDWFDTFLPERERDRIRALYARALSGERTRANVNPIIARDGREFEIEWYDAPLRGPSGSILGLLCIGLDVTARHRAEESLRDREARLTAILNTAADAIITIDEHGLIDSANPATERMFGYATADMIGQNVRMLMPPPYRDKHDCYLANYLKSGVKRIIGIGREAQGRRKDGTVFPVELAVSELFDGQRWFTGVIRDVSRRRELERQVLETATEEEQRIGRELHDGVGQELTGLGMLADALARQLDGSTEAQRNLATKLVDGLHRAHQQVRTMCRELVLTEMDGEGLRLALSTLADRTRDHTGVECSVDCPNPVTPPSPIAARHLYRIAQEAVSNAVRHGRPEHVRIELDTTAHGLRLCVEDDGTGVPNAGGHPWETRGLGLSTMRYRAGLIGGALHVIPANGMGVRVVCVVPGSDDHGQE